MQSIAFDKAYLRGSLALSLVHPPTMSLNKIELKYGTMKLQDYEKNIWIIEFGAIYLLGLKGSL